MEDGLAFVFRGTASANAAFSLGLREVLRKSPAALGTRIKTEVHTQGARE